MHLTKVLIWIFDILILVIFSSAWLCQQSSWNRNSSVVRPSAIRLWHRLSLKILHGFLSNVSCYFPWAISPEVFWTLEFFYEYFSISLTWDPTGANISKRYSSFKSLSNLFKPCLNFLLRGPQNGTVLDFWNFELTFFRDFCFRFR